MNRILLFSILACVIITISSPVIYRFWIGSKVEIPFIMTAVVALYVSIFCSQNLNGTLLVAMSKVKLNVIILTIGMCVHIPLSLILSKFIGCYGVLASMIIITLFYATIYKIQVDKLLSRTATGIWNE
jgi:O-antigen/teichoic acid export membrane protein